jgi:hypothetical protein
MAHLQEYRENPQQDLTPWQKRAITAVMYTAMHPTVAYQIVKQTQDIQPYLIKNALNFNSIGSFLGWVNKRDGWSSIWKGNLVGILWCEKFIIEDRWMNKFRQKGVLPKIGFKKYESKMLLNVFFVKTCSSLLLDLMFYPLESCLMEVCLDFEEVPNYFGALDCIWTMFTKRGLAALYKGFSWRILQNIAKGGFSALKYKLKICDDESTPKTLKYFFLEFVDLLVTYPLEVISSRERVCGDGLRGIRGEEIDKAINVLYGGLLVESSAKLIHLTWWSLAKFFPQQNM